ncbi:hypothetical protein CH54_801 [Yersinia rochesterensis]|uniref:Uncharacterized protein n=1 Tax=Yersinia rochesterensis TaxID=1604335 RepID=A0ABM5SHN1_9GAMM|nr:hypothetical protein DJ57_1648 [Yersinia rochesterensis]AJI85589.1 hypothetical protein AW19_861 [Yersinia frederiksenii Y225]AJJ33970.1 hypothetical protein CH54_801 [Yersinia rochesterensis]CNH50875.1 Uncharacterised protein [Yersinia kristensenii]CRY59052.1 Uncharacterised protein [Yersinia kristensenii]
MEKQRASLLFSLVFVTVMAMSAHSTAQAEELNSRPPLPIPMCYGCFSPIGF